VRRPDADAPVIAVERVSKRFGDVVAVDGVTFAVRRGEFFSVLGPSGCGKTTMLRMIAGFEAATAGVLRLDGVDVCGVPPYRRSVNTVFQNYALFPHLTVFDNIAFGPRVRGMERGELGRRVRQMLDVVRLGDFAGRSPSQLSGGQRQRVALARALVNQPSALLLDEPLSALDLALRRHMQGELKRIQREVGVTFVFVTHDQEEALAMSDRIAVMRGGRLEQVGAPEEVYDAPASAFVARFIGAANLLDVTVERVAGGRATVRFAGGRRGEVATGGGRFAAGGPAIVMVRPHRLRLLAAEPAPDAVALPVTCTGLVFQGAVLRCELEDAAGHELVAHVEATGRAPDLRTGAALWLAWTPDAARLLRPDERPVAAGSSVALSAGDGADQLEVRAR
jgi:spermidine/putrescine transport system ATP-binding protein